MNNISWQIDDDEEDEDFATQKTFSSGLHGLIFLIDSSSPMFKKLDCDKRPIILCLEACKEIIFSMIKSPTNNNIQIAIVFFGTENNENPFNIENVSVNESLQPFNAVTLKNINNLIKELDHDLEDQNSTPISPLKNGIWLCQKLFSESRSKFFSKRIAMMTATSSPKEDAFSCRIKAHDLQENFIRLDLFPFGSEFNYADFYKDFMEEANGTKDIQLPEPITNLEQLLALASNLDFQPRTQNRMNLYFSKDFKVPVSIYACSFERNWSIKPVKVERTSNDVLKSHVNYYSKESGKQLDSMQLKYKYKYKDHVLIFKQEERKKMRKLQSPGLRIIQFVKKDSFKWDHHFRACHFVACCEGHEESEEIIDGLLNQVMERGLVIHCWLNSRQGSKTYHVLLEPYIPSMTSPSNKMITLPGFLVHFLPFKQLYMDESFRTSKTAEFSEKWDATDSQVNNLANSLAKVMNTSDELYTPPLDPHEDTFWSNFEAIALEYTEQRPVVDNTVPNWPEDFTLEDTAKEIYSPFYDPWVVETKHGVKRVRPIDDDPIRPGKKLDKKRSVEDIKTLCEAKSLDICTVDELKDYAKTLEFKNISKLKKKDLINKLYEFFSKD